jgi:hypothetical protein
MPSRVGRSSPRALRISLYHYAEWVILPPATVMITAASPRTSTLPELRGSAFCPPCYGPELGQPGGECIGRSAIDNDLAVLSVPGPYRVDGRRDGRTCRHVNHGVQTVSHRRQIQTYAVPEVIRAIASSIDMSRPARHASFHATASV